MLFSDIPSVCSNYNNFEDVPYDLKCDCISLFDNDDLLFNYTSFYYCSSIQSILFIVYTVWLFFLFNLLAGTADEYLVPALTKLSNLLNLSPNIAGVTILAFANGAPDLFTSLAAFTGDSGGSADLGIGSLLGAGMFVTSMVFGAVIYVKPFTSYRRPFLRDLIFYILSVGLLYYVFKTGEIYLWQACIFIILYIIYVLIVVVGRYVYQKYIKPNKNKKKKMLLLLIMIKIHNIINK